MTLSHRDQRVRDTLHLATSTLAEVEERTGQDEMAMTIARSIDKRRHLVVQAGTGTGKTLGDLYKGVARPVGDARSADPGQVIGRRASFPSLMGSVERTAELHLPAANARNSFISTGQPGFENIRCPIER